MCPSADFFPGQDCESAFYQSEIGSALKTIANGAELGRYISRNQHALCLKEDGRAKSQKRVPSRAKHGGVVFESPRKFEIAAAPRLWEGSLQ